MTKPPESNVRRYNMTFADGKGATMLDMQREPIEELLRSVVGIFKPGYVVSVKLHGHPEELYKP
ncbi:hypothetical protein SKUL_66 [Pseudomonas phage Skulduggery]|uniref:Uncharacterized protein n=1 Tax=Pseudomonas phage Skulduggery TaxID=2006671 RepID=A0A1Y0SXB9_9CAUD|nr:hypothetical protein PP627_gp66 [Pseudomonas phage Skulduggery]ARV77165.1 hypothetical protein SKUL_66 [Pseudomonas phage Skulduggery]